MKEKTLGHKIINAHCLMRGTTRLRSPGLGYNQVGLIQDLQRQCNIRCCHIDEISGVHIKNPNCSINITAFYMLHCWRFFLYGNINFLFIAYVRRQQAGVSEQVLQYCKREAPRLVSELQGKNQQGSTYIKFSVVRSLGFTRMALVYFPQCTLKVA